MNKQAYYDAAVKIVNELLSNVAQPEKEAYKIGIAITTHTRPGGDVVLRKTLTEILKHRPPNSRVVVVDDASEYDLRRTEWIDDFIGAPDNLYHRIPENVGIARAKNKCFELLQGCDHLFLFDDDTFPLVPNWHEPYINSEEGHLMYIFERFTNGTPCGDIARIYEDDKIIAFTHVRGCMMYYKRTCLEKVGGMDKVYGRWGNEHADLSNRIHAAGLTTFRYMDVQGSKGLFYSGDEHQDVTSTFVGVRRVDALDSTMHVLERQRNRAEYREFRDKWPMVVSTYYTGVPDPQRGQKWTFSMDRINDLQNSVIGKKVHFTLLHDVQDMPTARMHLMSYKQVKAVMNPYFQRWIHYYQYLRANCDRISWAFLVDATDVEMLNMPEPIPGKLYIGSENTVINCDWLKDNHSDAVLKRFYFDYGNRQLLNAGVVGGYVDDLLTFCKSMVDALADLITGRVVHKQEGPGQTDMAALNLVAYTQFENKIITGTQVTTEFKANVRNNYSWFKHK